MARISDIAPTAGRYVNAADKALLAESGAALRIVDARYQARAMFGPRWLIDCAVLATGETVAIDFAAADKAGAPIEARMTMFGAMRDALRDGDTFDPVVLVRIEPAKGGNPFWTFEDASIDAVANPVDPELPNRDDADVDPAPENVPVIAGERLAKAKR